MEKKEWARKASSGEGEIFSRLWVQAQPKAVIELAHGMAEHGERYDHFARFLVEQGYAVCMNDHAGHGRSGGTKGHFADKNGWVHVVSDLHLLRQEVSGQYPGLPFFLMGHSMGSLLSRSYLTRYDGLTGCVLCGTIGVNPALGAGLALSSLQMKIRGPRSQGRMLDKLTSMGTLKRIAAPVNSFAWLTTVNEVCEAYEKDENCGYPFTAAGYHDLFTGLKAVTGTGWAEQVPKNLPLFVIAGAEDPMGAYGKGPQQVFGWLKETGHEKAALKLYPGMRHEILNEREKEQVYRDVLVFLDGCLQGEKQK